MRNNDEILDSDEQEQKVETGLAVRDNSDIALGTSSQLAVDENGIIDDSEPIPMGSGKELVLGSADELAVGKKDKRLDTASEHSVSRRRRGQVGDPRFITEINNDGIGVDRMGGGYASVKGEVQRENKLVWRVLIVMCVMCVAVGVMSSLLTAFFMRKGGEPATITTEPSQQVSAVVALRKKSVVEVACGGAHGSGVIVDYQSSKLYIITNAHVLDKVSVPNVRLYGEDEYYDAVTVGYNSYYDIAVLTVTCTPKFVPEILKGTEFFSIDTDYSEGDYVVAIGNAMSMGTASYDGIISKKSEILRHGEKKVAVMRTTAAVNAGMSGGGLFDMKGRLVGISTYRMSSTSDSEAQHSAATDVEDTGFVVPVSIAYSVFEQILGYGEGGETGMFDMRFENTASSYIGSISFIDLGFTAEYREGALTVTSLDAVSPSASVEIGDVIKSINSYQVTDDIARTVGEFLRYRRVAYTGTVLKIEFMRGSTPVSAEFSGVYKHVG